MTQYVPFAPSPLANFTFTPVLDGVNYNARVAWNAYGLRYYLYIYTTAGVLKLCIPLIESPTDHDFDLAQGYFNTKIVFRASSQTFEIG